MPKQETNISEERRQELVDRLIKQIEVDMLQGDTTVLDELLMKFTPVENVLQALPEEQWKDFPEVKIK